MFNITCNQLPLALVNSTARGANKQVREPTACIGALEFHHKNPKEKEFLISGPRLTYSLKRLTEEAKKCELLCSNCHKEIHYSHL